MIPRIDNRMYTNLILTVIAVLVAVQQLGGLVGTAQAQNNQANDLRKTATGAVIDTTIPQTQDVAVANATADVAAANRDIAAAILELAAAVREGSGALQNAVNRPAPAVGAVSAPAPGAAPVERPVIEVAP